MTRTVKHFSLHRISAVHPFTTFRAGSERGKGIELRVIADVEEGVLPLIEAETAVIQGYAWQEHWPHRWVTFFVLEDLQPLVRQLRLGENYSSIDSSGPSLGHPGGVGGALPKKKYLSPEDATTLENRSVVNVYDLANLAGCNVFVNRRAMFAEGYWDDALALKGLLAHEHAHPLAENETVRASRWLKFEISDFGFKNGENGGPRFQIQNQKSKIASLLTSLILKICLNAPRELFANEITIQSGFAEALLHLDLRNVVKAGRSVTDREGLYTQLQQEVVQGNLTPAAADLLLLVGDLSGYLDLALEVAPFYRAGRASDARALETALETTVFPRLDALLPRAFTSLRDQYIALRTDMTLPELITWGAGVLDTLTGLLSEKGLALQYRLWMAEE